jgi:hypothetical protein
MVKVQASQNPFGIDRVEFTVNGELVTTDRTAPYQWFWILPSFKEFKLQATAYDTAGNSSSDAIYVYKYF